MAARRYAIWTLESSAAAVLLALLALLTDEPVAKISPQASHRFGTRSARGVLDTRWSAWFRALRVTSDKPNWTVIA